MTTFDVLLPYYGDPDLMRRAVESVIAQTDSDWNLVVLDDAYPDQQIANWLTTVSDERISFERSPANLGVNGSFQALLQRSSADYVTFLGCDDMLLPQYVKRVRDLVDLCPDAAVVQPGVRVIDASGRPTLGSADRVKAFLRRRFPAGPTVVGGSRLASSLLTGNWTYFPSLAWKRSGIAERGFRKGHEVTLDLDLLFDVICGGGLMVLDSEIVFEYRRHAQSVSSTQASDGRRFVEEREFYRRAATACRDLGWRWSELAARAHITSRLHSLSSRASRG